MIKKKIEKTENAVILITQIFAIIEDFLLTKIEKDIKELYSLDMLLIYDIITAIETQSFCHDKGEVIKTKTIIDTLERHIQEVLDAEGIQGIQNITQQMHEDILNTIELHAFNADIESYENAIDY